MTVSKTRIQQNNILDLSVPENGLAGQCSKAVLCIQHGFLAHLAPYTDIYEYIPF